MQLSTRSLGCDEQQSGDTAGPALQRPPHPHTQTSARGCGTQRQYCAAMGLQSHTHPTAPGQAAHGSAIFLLQKAGKLYAFLTQKLCDEATGHPPGSCLQLSVCGEESGSTSKRQAFHNYMPVYIFFPLKKHTLICAQHTLQVCFLFYQQMRSYLALPAGSERRSLLRPTGISQFNSNVPKPSYMMHGSRSTFLHINYNSDLKILQLNTAVSNEGFTSSDKQQETHSPWVQHNSEHVPGP